MASRVGYVSVRSARNVFPPAKVFFSVDQTAEHGNSNTKGSRFDSKGIHETIKRVLRIPCKLLWIKCSAICMYINAKERHTDHWHLAWDDYCTRRNKKVMLFVVVLAQDNVKKHQLSQLYTVVVFLQCCAIEVVLCKPLLCFVCLPLLAIRLISQNVCDTIMN